MTTDSVTRPETALKVHSGSVPDPVRVRGCARTDETTGSSDSGPSTSRRSSAPWVRFGLAAAVTLTACSRFESGILEGLTNPLALQGLILSIDAPPAVDLVSAGFVEGASATVFLADAAEASALAQVPVREADVRLTGPSIGTVILSEVAPGTYAATPDDGLAYFEGELLELRVTIGPDLSQAGLRLPDAPVLNLPSVHPAGTDLVIDLTGQRYDAVLVAVFGPGGLTYSNIPGDIEALHDLTSSGGSAVALVPGNALGQAGGHAIGVAGLVKTGAADLDNVNTVLSSLGAAQMVFASVTVQ